MRPEPLPRRRASLQRGALIEEAGERLRFHGVDEGMGIDFTHGVDDLLAFVAGYHGIDEAALAEMEGTLAPENGRPVMRGVVDDFADLLRIVRDDEEGVLLIALVERVHHLRGGVLKDDGVERLVPAEGETGHHEQDHVEVENDVPGVYALSLRKVDGDEVGAAARGIHAEAETDGKAVDDAAENADEQGVVGDDVGRKKIGEQTGEHDHEAGVERELLADVAEPYVDGYHVQQKVDRGEGEPDVQKALGEALNENGEAGGAAGIETSGLHEGVDVESHEQRGQAYDDNGL